MGRRRRGRLRQFYRRVMEYKRFKARQRLRLARHMCPVCEATERVKFTIEKRKDNTYLVRFFCANCGASDMFILTRRVDDVEIYNILVDRLTGTLPSSYSDLVKDVPPEERKELEKAEKVEEKEEVMAEE